MTEVLNRPDPTEWSVDWTCGGCNAELRSTGADVGVGQFGAMGDYDSAFYVECPICARCKTWPMHTDDIPAHVKHDARTNRRDK